ncbi:unnamed protein product [Peronospora farinosa]|uniref:Reverse transcriptase domain-containing protein n=1 Tax=Peronospora farinosa TaxID=134698 RepID=A0ABN8C4L4_9STRA|nr:unnamed protein product [Peronospora farinosa]
MDPVMDEVTAYPHVLGRAEFRDWLLRLGVLDAWRSAHPGRREFTGPGRRNRIDYCFVSPFLFEHYLRDVRHVTDVRYGHEDHLPVRFLLHSPTQPPQFRLPWKCPRWLLLDPAVQAVLQATLDDLCDRIHVGPGSNPGALLDEHKRADAIFLREMFTARRNQDHSRLAELQQHVYATETAHAAAPTVASESLLLNAKSECTAFMELLASQRERAKFDRDISDRETGSKFFLRPPSAESYRVAIPGVVRADGSVTTDPHDMASLHRHYWGHYFRPPLATSPPRVPCRRYSPGDLEDLLRHTTARVSSEDQRFLDAPMTAHDFYWAITKSPKGKSSGFDGLPAEYYQLFPETWARLYELIYSAQFSRGRMTKFQRRAYISLLYKKGDRYDPKNYRPITLLNHDAKFGPKILAHRTGLILPKLIHVDQTGFVPGRSIRHALLRFQDLQAVCRSTGLPDAGAVLLDFAKAFDSVLWPALDQVLRHYGFGPNFRWSIRTFFHGTLVSVLVNGVKSDYFELGCGVRQGDPLSPALFVLFLEPMLNYLRATTGHLGVPVQDGASPHHLLAFADDCTGFLKDLRSTGQFISAVTRYTTAAGLQLNVDKTVVFPFQALDPSIGGSLRTAGYTVTADDRTTVLLGVSQSPTLPLSHRLDPLLPRLVARCTLWRYRARTLRGRAVILRTIVLPILWYTAAVTPLSARFVLQVQRLIKAFLFQLPLDPSAPSRAPMPSEWITWPTSKGGLGLPSISEFASSLHLCSLRDAIRYASRHMAIPSWFAAAASLLTATLRGNGVTFDILYAKVPSPATPPRPWASLGPFWYRTLQAWQVLRDSPHNTTVSTSSLLEAPLWDNHLFRVGGLQRPLAQSSQLCCLFRDLGYIRLRDFVDRHGALPSVDVCRPLLASVEFSSPRLRSLAVSHFVSTLDSWVNLSAPVALGPSPPDYFDLVSPRLAHSGDHGGGDGQPTQLVRSLASRPVALDLDVLPVLSDLKFRLQHNALNPRSKYQWRPVDVGCVHGCPAIETPRHLFWDCLYAQRLWSLFMPTLQSATSCPLSWEAVLYLMDIQLTPAASQTVGPHNFLRVLNVFRCCSSEASGFTGINGFSTLALAQTKRGRTHACCYARLHLRRLTTTSTVDRLCRFSDHVVSLLPPASRGLSPMDPIGAFGHPRSPSLT